MLQASLHDGIRSHQNQKASEQVEEEMEEKVKEQNVPSGEGAPVPGALEDGGLDALPAARGVAAGLASRHGWMLSLLGDLVVWAAIAIAIAVQAGRGDRSNKGRGGGGKGFGGRGVQARARAGQPKSQ